MQGLAFVGSEVITFNAVTNSFLQSEWLAALFQVRSPTAPFRANVCVEVQAIHDMQHRIGANCSHFTDGNKKSMQPVVRQVSLHFAVNTRRFFAASHLMMHAMIHHM